MTLARLDTDSRERLRDHYEKRAQMDELKRAIKAKIESEVDELCSGLLEKYKVLEIEDDILEVKRQLANDASGKAKDAVEERMMKHYNMMMGTNMIWGQFINSFGFAGFWKQLWS